MKNKKFFKFKHLFSKFNGKFKKNLKSGYPLNKLEMIFSNFLDL